MNPNNQPAISLDEKVRIRDLKNMKICIWIYFFLLIFEGAIRKWIVPELSDVFLIVRDPVAVFLLILAFKQRLFEGNVYILINYIACVLAFITTMIWGHANFFVAIYGLRIYALHFPLIFIIAKVFTVKDVLQVGKVLLWLSVPMAILIAIQFYSPQSAWVNRGIGGNLEGAGFSGANGYLRPPGVFSFTSGNTIFWGIVSAYVLFFLLQRKLISYFWLSISILCILIAIVFSISRSLFAEVMISITFLVFIIWRKPRYILSFFFGTAVVFIFASLFLKSSLLGTGLDALTSRFESASEVEGNSFGQSMLDRFFGGIGSVILGHDLKFWGKGIGMGTNAGAKLMTGKLTFLISEGEWGRLIGESGLLLGLAFIFLRIALVWKLTIQSIRSLRIGNTLPWMLLSFGFVIIIQGQWAQPTSLGFAVFTGGLILASLKKI